MDEMTLRKEHTSFYRYSKKGTTPIVRTERDPKIKVSFFGGLCLSDKKQVLHLSNKQNTVEMIEWLEQVKKKYHTQIQQKLPKHLKRLEYISKYKGLILIFLDGAGFHISNELKQYLKDNHGIFELFRFPAYSPELNPQEHVWKALRKHLSKTKGKYTFKQQTDRACRYLLTSKHNYMFPGE